MNIAKPKSFTTALLAGGAVLALGLGVAIAQAPQGQPGQGPGQGQMMRQGQGMGPGGGMGQGMGQGQSMMGDGMGHHGRGYGHHGVGHHGMGHHGRGEGGMMMGMMGGRGFERFCSVDVGYVTRRMADRMTDRLKLTDAQKPALAGLREAAVSAAAEAKKLCADKTDMTTATGHMDAMQKRLAAASTAMTAIKPKFDAFYAALDETQKKTVDAMHGRGGMGGR